MRAMDFNIYSGNKRPGLNVHRALVKAGVPKIAALHECGRWSGGVLGYKAHRAPRHLGEEVRDSQANVILTRRGTKTRNVQWGAVPNGEWAYEDNPRGPRVYGRLQIRVGRRRNRQWVWVYSAHRCTLGPRSPRPINRKAWIAEDDFLMEWDGPVGLDNAVWCADWNTTSGKDVDDKYSLAGLASRLGARIAMRFIDGFLVRGGKVNKVWMLSDRYGSDTHRPVVMDVTW